MAESKRKGDLGEAMVMADVLRRGYKVAIPVGEDWRYDLVVLRKGNLVRVQCKYVESNGEFLAIPCRSSNSRLVKRYTSDEIDWMACYDKTTDKCYYCPSDVLGVGMSVLTLRLSAPKNNQKSGVRLVSELEVF